MNLASFTLVKHLWENKVSIIMHKAQLRLLRGHFPNFLLDNQDNFLYSKFNKLNSKSARENVHFAIGISLYKDAFNLLDCI